MRFNSAMSTHIIGGEIFIDCVGQDTFLITLKIYRDCINGRAPYDSPAYIGVYDSAGVALGIADLPFPGSQTLPLVSINICLDPPSGVCVEEAVYRRRLYLPERKGGYQLAYQRCCRNGTILNIIDPLGTGATYYTIIPDTSVVTCNNTPRYKNFPPIFICQNQPLVFDHSATDPDGDSLVYEMCTPYFGANGFVPQPVPPSSPPYGFVTWQPPYSTTDMLGGIPLAIDPVTGLLTGTPTVAGQYVVGICVKEYRNGVLLTTNKRDFQFNVTFCPPKNSASLPANIISCGYTTQFQNNSEGAFSYSWDFGVTTATNDTSNQVAPSFTYPSVGTYIVRLITNKGFICADTAFATVTVYDVIDGANFSLQNVCVNKPASFTDLSVLTEGTASAWNWNFGDNSPIVTLQNPTHTFTRAGTYKVLLRVYNENGCSDTITKPIVIYPPPIINAGNDTTVCPTTNAFLNASGNAVSYTWNSSPYLSCLVCKNTIASPPTDSKNTFTVTAVSSNGCLASDSLSVVVRPVIIPNVRFDGSARCADQLVPFLSTVTNFDFLCEKAIQYNWSFGDGTFSKEPNPTHLFPKEGSYIVTLSVQNSALYSDTIALLSPDSCLKNIFIPNAFTPNNDGENDRLYLRTINATKILFRIYNRWGEEVFRTESLQEGWDGTYKGLKQTPQTFVYVGEVTFFDGTERTVKGNVTLIE